MNSKALAHLREYNGDTCWLFDVDREHAIWKFCYKLKKRLKAGLRPYNQS